MTADGNTWDWMVLVWYCVLFYTLLAELCTSRVPWANEREKQGEEQQGGLCRLTPLPTDTPSPLPSQPLGPLTEAGLCIRASSILNKYPQIKIIFSQLYIQRGVAVIWILCVQQKRRQNADNAVRAPSRSVAAHIWCYFQQTAPQLIHTKQLNLTSFPDHTDGPLCFSLSPQVTARTKVQM